MASVNRTIQIDAALNEQLDAMLSELDMTLDEFFSKDVKKTLNAWMLLSSTYFSTPETLLNDLQEARKERMSGVQYVPIEEAMSRIDRILASAEERNA